MPATRYDSAYEAVASIEDGATLLISGFGMAGQPIALINALIDVGTTDFTVVTNNSGGGETGISALLAKGRVRRMVCSYPRASDSTVFDQLYRKGEVELELVPQGSLAERIRAAGAGLGGFYTRTGVGTPLAEGKEHREIDGRTYVFESPIRGDFALIAGHQADERGNMTYRKTSRNFGPVMATAANVTIAQVREILPVGGLDPEAIVTPDIFVDRLVKTS